MSGPFIIHYKPTKPSRALVHTTETRRQKRYVSKDLEVSKPKQLNPLARQQTAKEWPLQSRAASRATAMGLMWVHGQQLRKLALKVTSRRPVKKRARGHDRKRNLSRDNRGRDPSTCVRKEKIAADSAERLRPRGMAKFISAQIYWYDSVLMRRCGMGVVTFVVCEPVHK